MKHTIETVEIAFGTFGNSKSKCYTATVSCTDGYVGDYGLAMGKTEIVEFLSNLVSDGTVDDYED